MNIIGRLSLRVLACVALSAVIAGIAAEPVRHRDATADPLATPETYRLYAALSQLDAQVFSGVFKTWHRVHRISNRWPALWSAEYYDDGPVESRGDDQAKVKADLIANFAAGGINSVHDHMYNFATGGDVRDRSLTPLAELLPGGSLNAQYNAYLTRLAAFLRDIRHSGVTSPILFRPFHEMNGAWFWWGGAKTAASYVRVWRYTFDYLTSVEGCHNLLWVWSPSVQRRNYSPAVYEAFWPGAAYVDIIGIDGYDDGNDASFGKPFFKRSYDMLQRLADREGLPIAWTEVGFGSAGQRRVGFWQEDFLASLKRDYPRARYFVLWSGRWTPQVASPAAASAAWMFRDAYVLTRDEVALLHVYGAEIGN